MFVQQFLGDTTWCEKPLKRWTLNIVNINDSFYLSQIVKVVGQSDKKPSADKLLISPQRILLKSKVATSLVSSATLHQLHLLSFRAKHTERQRQRPKRNDPIDLYCAKHTKLQTMVLAMMLENQLAPRMCIIPLLPLPVVGLHSQASTLASTTMLTLGVIKPSNDHFIKAGAISYSRKTPITKTCLTKNNPSVGVVFKVKKLMISKL